MPVGFGKEWVMETADTVDISDDDTDDVQTHCEDRIDFSAVKNKALWLLSRQDYSVKCMREKLLDKGATTSDADKVIEYLINLSYLDDERFARSYVRTHSNNSRMSLRQKLYHKGIDSDLAESAIADSYTGDSESLIENLARKKHFDLLEADYESTCKFKAYLYRRGFSSSEIRRFFEK